MDKEQIRVKLIDACVMGALADIRTILENHLTKQDDFSRIIFEQAVFHSINSGNINSLTLLLTQESHVVSPMSYSYLFDRGEDNKEVLQLLCFKLPDIEELKNLYIEDSSNKSFIKDCINTRIEKDIFETHINQPTGETKRFKI